MTYDATLPLDQERLAAALAGRYTIARELGAGGNATVYLAEDLRHSRPVAIKVLTPDLARLLGTERFLREIAVAARLRHPHLVPLFDSGETADPADPARRYLFYVMPLVEGASLRDRLEQEPRLPLDEALAITRDIAAALTYAHEHDVVHRDIKPENILLDSGRAVLADFGIARAVSAAGAGRLTQQGLAIGTPAYMSPEQVAGEDIDARSDVYSLACVLYEMLDSEPPFAGPSPQAVMARRLSEPVRPLAGTRGISPALNGALLRGLATSPRQRYPSAAAFVGALQQAVSSDATRLAAARGARRRSAILAGVSITLAATALTSWHAVQAQRRNHLVDRQVPGITQAIERGDIATAYQLAERAERLAPGHPLLRELWPRVSARLDIEADPAGAAVAYKAYDDSVGPWQPAGKTPIAGLRLAIGTYRMLFTAAGYDTLEMLVATPEMARELFVRQGSDTLRARPDSIVRVRLSRVGEATGLVRINVDTLWAVRNYSGDLVRLAGAPFWIGRYEVTNEEWQRFVDAGGYEDSTWWDHPLLIDGVARPWATAMRRFVDRTGRPGPAAWEGGTYPAGHERFPVTGVSWYEASAYARFVQRNLPTIYHWFTASGWNQIAAIGPLSNLESGGPAPVGQYRAVNRYGAFDFIGNAKEWTATPTDGSGKRHLIAGGSWLNPHYFATVEGQDAWQRPADVGLRLMRNGSAAAEAFGPVDLFDRVHPFGPQIYQTATEAEFRLYRDELYGYTRTPLRDSVIRVDDESRLWRRELVSFAAAYGGQRIPAWLFIPKGPGLKPPYQAVVYVPTGLAWDILRDSRNLGRAQSQHDYFWEFVALSGRAVLYPIYQGTFERHVDLPAGDANAAQTLDIEVVQDVRRAVDYLASRPDIDTSRIAYYGASAGAWYGPIASALEPRFKAAVLLLSGCLNDPRYPRLPPVTPMRFLPFVKVPVLSIAGADDYVLSDGRACLDREFGMLGTRPADRKQLLYPGNHGLWGTFGYQGRQEILAWLDRYLGRVGAGGSEH